MALALQRDVAARERHAVGLCVGLVAVDVAAAVGDAAVLDDGQAVDVVHDALVAEHEHVGRDPRRRRRSSAPTTGCNAMASGCARVDDARSRRADDCRSAAALPSLKPPRNCTSIEIGKSWSRCIVSGACECTMTPLLRAAQAGRVRRLRADEPVLDAQPVVRERLGEEQVPELLVERVVAVVRDGQQAVASRGTSRRSCRRARACGSSASNP